MARKPGFLHDPNEGRQVLASPGSELTISLMPEALIKGRVILSTTDAAMGINVQILSRQVQVGDQDGTFSLYGVIPGSYAVLAIGNDGIWIGHSRV